MTAAPQSRVADASAGNWADRWMPAAALPYARLARFDRPIGAWLLLFPCWWGQALAELATGKPYPNIWYLALFLIGAFVMRGAGCTHNDILDRHFDAKVARTASRPIPSGAVSVKQALAFAVGLSLIGFVVLIQFNRFTIWLAIASLGLVAIYPLAKRVTNWPQVVLGLTFKWGALVGWATITGGLAWPALVLYAGAVLWTIGYDTIYAHQDKEDDSLIGLKSTALHLDDRTHGWVGALYAGAVICWTVAAVAAGGRTLVLTTLAMIALQMSWQVATLDTSDPANCLARFKSNRIVGWLLFLGLAAETLWSGALSAV